MLALARPEQRDVGAHQRRLGQVGELGPAQHPGDAPLAVERGRPGHDDLAAPTAGVHAGLDHERLGRGAVAEPPEAHVRRIVNRVGGEEQRAADHADDGSHLEVGRGERHAGGDQPPGAFVIGRHHDAAVVEHGRRAGHELHPRVVAVLEEDVVVSPLAGSAASTCSRRWSRLCTVSTIRSGSGHCTSARYGSALVVPSDLAPAAVEAEHPERHIGVGRPGRRVGVLGRRRARAGPGR